MRYAFDESRDLKGSLIAIALALLALDTLAVFWMGGVFAPAAPRRARGRFRRLADPAGARAARAGPRPALPAAAEAQRCAADRRRGDRGHQRHPPRLCAHRRSADRRDQPRRAAGLSRFLAEKTALEPGEPAGVDIATDELAFYPLIYWPIDPNVPMPAEAAIARVDAYMQQGGTVLFDTRDQYATGITDTSASPATQRLRDILSNLNVPPLEPVPPDHVLTKSFFILNDFPRPLQRQPALGGGFARSIQQRQPPGAHRRRRLADHDHRQRFRRRLGGRRERRRPAADRAVRPDAARDALRSGVNIVMYMLTGNYKSDQVHVPVLLERLGQ